MERRLSSVTLTEPAGKPETPAAIILDKAFRPGMTDAASHEMRDYSFFETVIPFPFPLSVLERCRFAFTPPPGIAERVDLW